MFVSAVNASPKGINDVKRKRIIIGHPWFGRGGSEAVAMWLAEALRNDHDVTVLTTGGWDLAALNAHYGTHVSAKELEVRIAPVPWPARRLGVAALRAACFQRFARKVAGEYDIRISAYNFTDWGLPAVHLIADFSWHRQVRQRLDPLTPGFIYRDSWLRKMYLGIAKRYQDPSGREILQEDTVIANSHWTAELLREVCEVECAAVVYPPVYGEFPDVAWQDKKNAFVMIGRVAPEKRIEEAIEILQAVRQRGHAIQLHLCGTIGRDLYGRKIAELSNKHADWIVAEGFVTGDRKTELLAHCRYGIQTRSAEPFGISVAEMMNAGAIVFAPDDGGQAEILDHPGLLFSGRSEAVEKISAALECTELQDKLREHLAVQAQRFSSERFVRDARACISNSTEVHV